MMNELSWCCIASMKPGEASKTTTIHRISDGNSNHFSSMHRNNVNDHYDNETCNINNNLSSSSVLISETTQLDRLDLTKAPDWMEYVEIVEHRRNEPGGAGAYDTMRGDLQCTGNMNRNDNQRWYIWGQDFHIQRLQKSYLSLLSESNSEIKSSVIVSMNDQLQRAVEESEIILQSLLREAENASQMWTTKMNHDPPNHNDTPKKLIYMVRLTLLWSRGNSNSSTCYGASRCTGSYHDSIVVRGHACSNMYPIDLYGPIASIECSIAAEIHHHTTVPVDSNSTTTTYGDSSSSSSGGHEQLIFVVAGTIPSRYHNPRNKVASWTRIRKTLEAPERYKPPGVSEVIMVRSIPRINHMHNDGSNNDNNNNSINNTDLEVLEGLSSNVFIIYKDGTIRTAVDGVLHGYVRQLVLDCAVGCGSSCGLILDVSQPIRLQEVHEWKEAFITSSSRLLYPISKIMIQHHYPNGETVVREFWQDPVLTSTSETSHAKPKWREMYDAILRQAGY
jgi:Amino-transferase class IV